MPFKLPPQPSHRDRLRVLASWAALLLALGICFMVSCIALDVNRHSRAAMRQFGGDRVTALTRLIESPSVTLNVKNDAIWALGQLGDARALPVLEKHYHGGACNHDSAVCQYELKKALSHCRGDLNLTAPFWRWAVSPHDSLKHAEETHP